MLSTGCVSQAARTTEGPPTGPPPAPSAQRELPTRAPLEADGGTLEQAQGDAAARRSPPASAPEVFFDRPYPLDARPRSASPLQAAAEDEDLARWNVGGSADPSYPSSQASYHPGTRVVVDTRVAKHRPGSAPRVVPKQGLSAERVQAQARSHGYWPFRLCFEAAQREKKSDGGETRVAFTIGIRGKVKRSWLLESKLGSPRAAACLVRETSRLEFTPPPARALSMVASIRIWPGDAPLPALPDAGTAAAVAAGGAFDPDAVRALVENKRPELNACFLVARSSDPSLWGRLALAAILEVDGTVHRISEVESHFPNAAAARCAQRLLAGVVFPSVNGKPFTLVIPIRLGPPSQASQSDAGPDLDSSPPEAPDDAASD